MIVKQQFYCTQENHTYKVGDLYNGKRKDLTHLLEGEIEVEYEDVTPKKVTKKRK